MIHWSQWELFQQISVTNDVWLCSGCRVFYRAEEITSTCLPFQSEIQCVSIFLVQIPFVTVGCAGDWMVHLLSYPGFSISRVSSSISLILWEMSTKVLGTVVVFQHFQAMGNVFQLCSCPSCLSNCLCGMHLYSAVIQILLCHGHTNCSTAVAISDLQWPR